MRIAHRLYLQIAVVVAGLIAISLIAYHGLGAVYDAADFAAVDTVPALVELGAVRTDFQRTRILVLRYLLLAGGSQSGGPPALRAQIDQSMNAARGALQQYRKTIADARDSALLQTDLRALGVFRSQVHLILAAADAHDAQRIRSLVPPGARAAGAMASALHQHIRYNQRLSEQASRAALAYRTRVTNLLVAGSLVVLFLVVALGLWTARSITRPLQLAVGVAREVANGNMTVQLQARTRDEAGLLLEALSEMVRRLRATLSSVLLATGNMASAADQVSETAQALAQGAAQQAASVDQSSSALEQAQRSVQDNAENTASADSLAQQVMQRVRDSNESVGQTTEAMRTIAQRISIIDDIAYQTNMLALNAAIEAARAGQHGKGFAVVAAEVRKLAERSQSAAKEIMELSARTLGSAEHAASLLGELVDLNGKSYQLVREIASATAEQSSGMKHINQAIARINSATQGNAAASEQLAATAEEMNTQAQELQRNVRQFRLDGSVQPSQIAAHS
jgi:methyl-accepting chemotaxis protein